MPPVVAEEQLAGSETLRAVVVVVAVVEKLLLELQVLLQQAFGGASYWRQKLQWHELRACCDKE